MNVRRKGRGIIWEEFHSFAWMKYQRLFKHNQHFHCYLVLTRLAPSFSIYQPEESQVSFASGCCEKGTNACGGLIVNSKSKWCKEEWAEEYCQVPNHKAELRGEVAACQCFCQVIIILNVFLCLRWEGSCRRCTEHHFWLYCCEWGRLKSSSFKRKAARVSGVKGQAAASLDSL